MFMMLKTSTFTLIFLTTAIGAEADKAIKSRGDINKDLIRVFDIISI